jgi:murein DD-endopeptidase MepM/ murein hydrolase activator NlpD
VYAIRGGAVVHISTWSGNCYADPQACVDTCGTGLTIEEADGTRWIYCHASRLLVQQDQQIGRGQEIMLSGNTGHSSGPHVHVGLRVNGIDYCPQPILEWLANGAAGVMPRLTTAGCTA